MNQSTKDKIGIFIMLLSIMMIGGAIRLFFVLRADFPVNDGGMFYTMVKDLLANHYAIPRYTTYNFSNIPFAYPPLPFYIAAVIHDYLGIDLFTIFHFLPVIINILTIPAFFALSYQLLGSPTTALLSTLVFAVISPSFEWLIMGGGLTRSLGYFFSILALYQIVRLLQRPGWATGFLATLLLGLIVWSHLEMLWTTVAFFAIAVWFLARNRQGFLIFSAVVAGATILGLPYVLIVAHLHGFQTFLAALGSGEFEWQRSVGKLLLDSLSGEYLFTPILVIGIISFIRSVLKREFLLPAWVLVTVALNPRSMERSIAIPLSILAAQGIQEIILPAIRKMKQNTSTVDRQVESNPSSQIKLFPNRASAILIAYLLMRSMISGPLLLLQEGGSLQYLTLQDRQAMQWVSENTSPESQFLILCPPSLWGTDERSEWFPVLAQRKSVMTVQGSEWLPGNIYNMKRELYLKIQECLNTGFQCIEETLQSEWIPYTHVYLSGRLKDTSLKIASPLPVEQTLRKSIDYTLIFEQGDVLIFKKNSTP